MPTETTVQSKFIIVEREGKPFLCINKLTELMPTKQVLQRILEEKLWNEERDKQEKREWKQSYNYWNTY